MTKAFKPWSDEDTAELLRLCKTYMSIGVNHQPAVRKTHWEQIAAHFGRSIGSCKHRYGDVKRRAEGRPRYRDQRVVNPKYVYQKPEDLKLRQNPIHLPPPSSITAWLCGDPLPGRSALDQKKKREGVLA